MASSLQQCRPAATHGRRHRAFSVAASAKPRQAADGRQAPVAAAAAGASGRQVQPTTPAGVRASRRAALAAIVAGIATLKVGAAEAEEKRDGEVRHSEEEWRQLLTPQQYKVLRKAGTEFPRSSPLADEHRTGTFSCAGCGTPLFSSETKYESGTGWPSFYDVMPKAVTLKADLSIPFMPRTEVRCRKCQGHLGHVFNDGPAPTRQRYCMNGAAMTFQPQKA